jgi:shikimate 5-dehydrogenase
MDLDYRTDSILKSLLPSQLLELKGLDMLIWQAIQQNAIFCR